MRNPLSSIRRHSLILIIISTLAVIAPFSARAGDFRIGFSGGYGGTGIKKAQEVNGALMPVERSEGPGIFSIFADYLLNDDMILSLEQIRGFRLGPFSTGVSFTGLAGRWYYLGSPSSVPRSLEETSTLLIKRFSPFIGGAAGVAIADISRDNDQIANVSGSGLYLGFKAGADYPLFPGVGLRPEIMYSSSLPSADSTQTSLTEFAIHLGIYFML